MGLGDNLMATGMARGAHARGKRIAFGDGQKIIWDHHSPEIFRNNPNIAPLGSENAQDIEWHPFRRGNRIYNHHDQANDRWIWNYGFRPVPGEMFFDDAEKRFAERLGPGFILIEPNVAWDKPSASNKDWGLAKYQAVADRLRKDGHTVAQFSFGRDRLRGVKVIEAKSFRLALSALSRARMAVLPEGGLHHGAAAVGIPAVVLFGGFIPPQVTGYGMHTNLTGGAVACGNRQACDHCKRAMESISVDDVWAATQRHPQRVAA